MTWRIAGWSVGGMGGVFALVLLAALSVGGSPGWAQRLFFIIATGPSSGTYFPVGEGIAAIISHPPGLHRCDAPGVCGPAGLIASAQTSAGALSNVLDVNDHRVNSALAQSDVVAEAVAGKGAFTRIGLQKHIAVIADLFPEDVHLVAAKRARIANVAALRGKRVSLGDVNSGTAVTAHAVLAAYRISTSQITAHEMSSDEAADALQKGKLDAFFFVGGAPVALVRDLVQRGVAVLVPINGAGRERLIRRVPDLTPTAIAAQTYPGVNAVQTVSVRALWIVNKDEPADLVYSVTRSLFNPANRELLDSAHPSARKIALDNVSHRLPAPLHPGAARFYGEMGKLPKPPVPAGSPLKTVYRP